MNENIPGYVIREDLDSLQSSLPALIEAAYRIFINDFLVQLPTCPIEDHHYRLKQSPIHDNYSCTFRHLCSEGQKEETREFRPDRLIRIPWVRMMLDEFALLYPAAENNHIRWWLSNRPGKRRIAIALCDYSFVIILEVRKNKTILPWTAYPITHRYKKEKLKKAFENHWKNSPVEMPPW